MLPVELPVITVLDTTYDMYMNRKLTKWNHQDKIYMSLFINKVYTRAELRIFQTSFKTSHVGWAGQLVHT